MRVRNSKYEITGEIISNPFQRDLAPQKTEGHPKLKASVEKKIERILFDSKKLGWSHDDFVSYLFEVLIVLQKRNNLDLRHTPYLTAPQQSTLRNCQPVRLSPVQQTRG